MLQDIHISGTAPRFAPPIVSRADYDFYPTPPEAVRALLSVEQFDGDVWEPACGDGAISSVLSRAGLDVHSTDLVDRGFGTGGIDFLAPDALKQAWPDSEPPKGMHIITNPPYSYQRAIGDRFVGQALRRVARKRGLTPLGEAGSVEAYDGKRHTLTKSSSRAPARVRIKSAGVARGVEVLAKARATPMRRKS